MFTQIVVLYICYLLELPTWCKALMVVGMAINCARFGYGFCKGYNKNSEIE